MIGSLSGILRQAGNCASDRVLGCRRRADAAWLPPLAVRRRGCHHQWQQQWRVYASSSNSSSSGSGAAGNGAHAQKRLTILHFNDVYNIEQRAVEPVGGAARFAAAVRRYRQEDPLVLFSGDCLNPSLMSAFTRGEQMVPVLNCIGVHAAATGNHDFDFGIAKLQKHMQSFRFPWLLSNVLDARTGRPLGDAERTRIIEWQGVRVGLMALVEREWLLTIPSIEEQDIEFLDFCQEGRRLAAQLTAEGAEIIVALTHMRTPNDLILAAQVPEIQLVLGGHDHHYEITRSEPHGTLVFKSGTDFREFSILRMGVPASLADRPQVEWERVEITSAVPEDPEMAGIVQQYQDLIGTKMDEPLGWTHTPLDARFDTVRRLESNVGSMFADIMRISLGADVAFFNGGTIRSDQIHAAGQLLMRDFVSMLPFTDELVLLELTGQDILTALETGVGSWPALEGRFLQVSGVTFAFDSRKSAGSRIPPGSVQVAGQPLDLDRKYKVATKAYLRGGKDGFESLKTAEVLVDGETNPRLATLVQYLWMRVEQLNETLSLEWSRMVHREQQRQQQEQQESDGEERQQLQEEEQEEEVEAAVSRDGSATAVGDHREQQSAAAMPAVSNGANGSSSSRRDAGASHGVEGSEPAAAAAATVAGVAAAAAAVYAPGAPSSGTAVGGPGSIPLAAEQHVQEVSHTGAAISLALLLQQRSEQQEEEEEQGGEEGSSRSSSGGSGSRSDATAAAAGGGAQGGAPAGASSAAEQWISLQDEEQQAFSSAALSALSYLEPCTHGLDELIVFDAVRRKFGIAPQVEGRIRRMLTEEQQQQSGL